MTEILYENGFIYRYKFDDNGPQGTIKIARNMTGIGRFLPFLRDWKSEPSGGCSHYQHVDGFTRVLSGLGMAIINFQRSDDRKKKRRQNVGGEVLCYVY